MKLIKNKKLQKTKEKQLLVIQMKIKIKKYKQHQKILQILLKNTLQYLQQITILEVKILQKQQKRKLLLQAHQVMRIPLIVQIQHKHQRTIQMLVIKK